MMKGFIKLLVAALFLGNFGCQALQPKVSVDLKINKHKVLRLEESEDGLGIGLAPRR